MTPIIRDGTNTPRTITGVQVRDGGNVVRDISEIRARDSNNVSRVVFSIAPPMTVDISPASVAGSALGSGTVTTDIAGAIPTGGTPPYTYLWSVNSYSNPTPPTINSPTSSGTTFTQTGVMTFDDASFDVLVTDDDGNTAGASCSASFFNFT